MDIEQAYYIPKAAYAEDSFEEKRSRFIGRLWKVETAEEALEKMKQAKELDWKARHHCWGYLIREGNLMRYSDDGEPQGTAGTAILEVLQHHQLTNVCCMVTRYFGGILLGTGGLRRAYSRGAKIAVAKSGVLCMSLFDVIIIPCAYAFFDQVQHSLPQFDVQTTDIQYAENITIHATLPVGKLVSLNDDLAQITAGKVQAQWIETKFMGRDNQVEEVSDWYDHTGDDGAT